MRHLIAARLVLLLLIITLNGCASNWPTKATSDFAGCRKDYWAMALIPDFGITLHDHMEKCMYQHGWLNTYGSGGPQPHNWNGLPRPPHSTEDGEPLSCQVNGAQRYGDACRPVEKAR
jgi:hypothetical protein